MNKSEKMVKQITYEDFPEYSQTVIAMATKWANDEGLDVYIQRKDMPGIQIALAHDDVATLRKMFSDLDF